MVELAAFRDCTATPNAYAPAPSNNIDSENREGDCGWPGMMTIKVHELDGTHDHLLPMAGDACQVLEIKCHSRLAAKRFQKSKKSAKPDGSDDNGDTVTTVDIRSRYLIFLTSNGVIVTVSPPISEYIYAKCSTESPLLWVRADPEMEYLAHIHFNQPLQMWVRLRVP